MKHALFPLHTVMFPGSILPLKIFEQRYLNLVKKCMKQQTGFVTVLISEGKEVESTPQVYSIGCYVEIIDWDALGNGLLGINIQAKYRVRLHDSSVKDDGLLFAEASPFQSTLDHCPLIPTAYQALSETLKLLLNHPYAAQYKDKINFDDTASICYHLSDLLPISNKHKQLLLETETTEQMLDQLALHINALQSEGHQSSR